MEQMSNTKAHFNNQYIKDHLFHTYDNDSMNKLFDTFNEFLDLISTVSNNTVSWRKYSDPSDHSKPDLYLFSTEWSIQNRLNDESIAKTYFNNTIIDSNFKLLMYGGPKVYDSNRDDLNLEDLINRVGLNHETKYYESYEGTSINVFYSEEYGRWFYTTKKKFNMYESKFGSTVSHGSMLDEIVKPSELEKHLDTKLSYHFVLVHEKNSHLLTNSNKLVLVGCRQANNSVELKQIHESIQLPKEITFEEAKTKLESDELNSQGVIVQHKML